MFKSETGKDPIISFVGLRAKMYSFLTESDHKEHMKAKGVSKEAMGQLHHEDYVQCLKEGSSNIVRMESIRSYEQQLYTVEMFKKGLSCNDVKRWICDDGIETKPYGYNPLEDEKRTPQTMKWKMVKKRKRKETTAVTVMKTMVILNSCSRTTMALLLQQLKQSN